MVAVIRGGSMKDVIRHLRHTQKKVLRSARKEQYHNNINSSLSSQSIVKGEENSYYKNIR